MITSKSLVVIITRGSDAHVPYVTKHLRCRYVVLDPLRILSGAELSYSIDDKLRVSYNGAWLDDVISVWYRKPLDFLRELIPVKSSYQDYAQSALQNHWYMVRSLFNESFWLSDYYDIKRADSKPLQLVLAKKIGFNTPDTLMTSSPALAAQFIRNHRSVIVKAQSRLTAFDENGDDRVLLATRVDSADPRLVSGLNIAPAIFQEHIDTITDIRVNVIGSKVFAASISGSAIDKPTSPVRDWKIAHYEGSVDIAEYKLPKVISDKCVAHVYELGLNFGAIDLVLDKKGEYWFLENNPNGQWAFVEDATGQPIGEAIAKLLQTGAR